MNQLHGATSLYVTAVRDTAAAEQLISDRQAYGAIDLRFGMPQVIIASAASTAVVPTPQAMATGNNSRTAA
ncbi:hypothetical protein [Nocardia vinacea]|uniref:hypothetical protein n=1 Tax=Nocardia vinacea TaxID=96468 RepID=UPI0003071735|nr:hypothetical protein [Nocardia vinacea]